MPSVVDLAAIHMVQTHISTCLHPSVECNLQQHPHQLQPLQQLVPWQLQSEGLASLRPAVRSVQGSLKMSRPVTELPGGSPEYISHTACRRDVIAVQRPAC